MIISNQFARKIKWKNISGKSCNNYKEEPELFARKLLNLNIFLATNSKLFKLLNVATIE
jgi:hypothetical protein